MYKYIILLPLKLLIIIVLQFLIICLNFSDSSIILYSPSLSGVPHAVMLEYPIFGSLHTFLICKRRGKVFGSTNTWGGLQLDLAKDKVVFALPESDRESLSCLLDNPSIRRRPFHQMLKEPICDVDQLLFALQIVHGLQFLSDNGVS